MIIAILAAASVGCTIGFAVAAMCVAAGREDEAAERTLYQEDKRRSGLLEEGEE